MKSGKGYRKLWLKLFSILAVFVSLFVYSNLRADMKEYDAKVMILADGDLVPMLVHDIADAKQSIYMAIYMFKTSKGSGDTEVLKQALLKAAANGVKIYIVMDKAGKKDITTGINKQTGSSLKKAGIEIVYDNDKIRLHAKTTVIDGHITYIGSHNYTESAMNHNREITARIVSNEAAADTINFIKSVK